MAIIFTEIESEEQEIQRLGRSPIGSKAHGLAAVPVKILDFLEGQIIKLPRVPFSDGTFPTTTIVVVPTEERHHYPESARETPRHRFPGSWDCTVVYSDDERYPVGGYRLTVPAYELARGEIVALEGLS